MNHLIHIIKETAFFFNEVSVYLLLGFAIAGLLHVIFPDSMIRRHLGKNSLGSVIKSTLFGIPLPLCSCGVVPVAASLKKSGASKGAVISFLISTPQVGADSFMITCSLLGWVFGLFRIAAALITAMTAGIMVNLFANGSGQPDHQTKPGYNSSEKIMTRLKSIFSYMEFELLGSIANSLVGGIVLAGIITALIPDGFLEKYLGNTFLSMAIMLVVGIPMYVCATASTPIAASLIMKGISPGAALVFLLTGPATNAVTISAVVKTLGKKSAAIYLAAIASVSIILGYILNVFTMKFGFSRVIMLHEHEMLPQWLKLAGSIVLVLMLVFYYFKTKLITIKNKDAAMDSNKISLKVEGMTCMHCSNTVKKAVESIEGTSEVFVDLKGKKVDFGIEDTSRLPHVKLAVNAAGYDLP
ncbi:MAG: permease [bacterium]